MEEYSSGRRGVTRNLVGLLQGARVQIPSPPPSLENTIDATSKKLPSIVFSLRLVTFWEVNSTAFADKMLIATLLFL